jgi:hypothetical protein
MDAVYVFRVRFRVHATGDATLAPDAFETTFRYAPPNPGSDGWQFFRNYLWRGAVTDHEHARRFVDEHVEGSVERVEFRSLRADAEYVDALRDAVAEDLGAFNAENVDGALSKYLGSSVDVVDDPTA